MNMLIFELCTVSILLCNVPEHVVGQSGLRNGNQPEKDRIEMNSQLRIASKSPLYIMSNIDKISPFRKARFPHLQTAGNFNANPIQLTGKVLPGYYVPNGGSISFPAYHTYSDLQFELEPKSSTGKLELVRKLDLQFYQSHLKSLAPSSYTKKKSFIIAEQLLFILLQENLRRPLQ